MTKTIVVSGAGGGIGFALVQYFLKEDCNVVAITRNKIKFNELNTQFGKALQIIQVDFLHADYQEILATEITKIKQIDVLVNNAGLLINKPFEYFTTSEILEMVQVNYLGAIELTKACLPLLRNSQYAHVVNVSTMGAVQGSMKFAGLSIYASTKAAICTFTEVMAEEYKNKGIHFNCLALGSVETSMFKEAFPGQKASAGVAMIASYIVDFALNKRDVFNGKILQVASDTP
jgi:3-oxoacyl-[acyl-carrier protein] reductase